MAESDGPCIIELGLIQGSQRYLTCENQMHESRSTSGMHVQLNFITFEKAVQFSAKF